MPLETPMVQETKQRVEEIINYLHEGNHVDAMTKKWLSQTPSPPRVPVFYTQSHKNSQTTFKWETYNSALRWPNGKHIIIFRPHPTAYRQSTKILPQRYHTVHHLYRKEVKRKVPNNAIFQASVRNYLNCVPNCDDHGLLYFKSAVQYMKISYITSQRDPIFHGSYQPEHQYSSRRRNKHCIQSI